MSISLIVDTDASTIGSTLADYPEDVGDVLNNVAEAYRPTEIEEAGAQIASHLDASGTKLIRAIAAKLGG